VDDTNGPSQIPTFPEVDDAAAGILCIRRLENPWRDRLSRYWVYIDSVKSGWLRRGDVSKFPLEPGEHRVQLRYSCFLSSKEIVVVAQPMEVVELSCGPGGPALLAPLYWALKPHQTISLETAGA
jgi:hypothetical protein